MFEESKEAGSGPSKSCVVCGDRALSCNFGAITCESCKAFFRRHAHKEIYGQCDGSCPITVETRSYCRRCRLAKCFTVGMKKDLILSDEQKQRRRQKILENRSKRQSSEVFTADSSGIPESGAQNSDLSPSMELEGPGLSGLGWTGPSVSPPEYSSPPAYGSPPEYAAPRKRDAWDTADRQYTADDMKRVKKDDQSYTEVPEGGFGLPGFPPTPYSDSTSPTVPLPPVSKLRQTPGAGVGAGAVEEVYKPAATDKVSVGGEDAPKDSGAAPYMDKPAVPGPSAETSTKADPALMELCFFGLHPPTLETESLSRLDKISQDCLLTAIEAYRELCRPMTSIHDKPTPEDYVTLLNRGEECYRQLVSFSKRLPEFRALSQDDQIALLKGNVIEIMIVRFSKCYNINSQSWMFPHCGEIQSYPGLVESEPVFSGFCVQDYSDFVLNALDASRGDDLILIMLKVVTLFWPEVPNLENVDSVRDAFDRYNRALENYLALTYPADCDMLPKIRQVMQSLRRVGKKLHDVMWNSQIQDLHPLLKEMFDFR